MPPLIYLHVPKCGGSTMTNLLYRQYWQERARIVKVNGWQDGSFFRDLPRPLDIKDPVVVLGHVYWGVHEHLGGQYEYATMLREPITRALSQYSHFLYHREHPMHVLATSRSLEVFLAEGHTTLIDNAQTRFLSGKWDIPYGACTPSMLEEEKENLRRCAVVGLLEEFDASLVLMQGAFSWRPPYYVRMNVSRTRITPNDISDATVEHLARQTALDLELYDMARVIFREQVERSEGFSDRLREFRLRNMLAAPRIQWSQRAWKVMSYLRGAIRRQVDNFVTM